MKEVIEGWIYIYCHPDDCQIIITKREITPEDIRKYLTDIKVRGSYITEKEIKEQMKRLDKFKEIRWDVWWQMEEDKIGEELYKILEKYAGKKVRITVEVI